MRKTFKNYIRNKEIDINNLDKRPKKSQSIIQTKNIINNTDIKKLYENDIGVSKTFRNNLPNSFKNIHKSENALPNIELEKYKREMQLKRLYKKMVNKKLRQNYNYDVDIKDDLKQNKDKSPEISGQLQRLNIFIYDAINNMDRSGKFMGIEQKAKQFNSNNKYLNSFINKINSLRSDEKNNGKISFEQFLETGFLQKEGITIKTEI